MAKFDTGKRRAFAGWGLPRGGAGRGMMLVSPPLIYAILLLAGPLLVVVLYSFWTQDYLTIDRTFTLENYRQAFSEPIYRDLLFRSPFVSVTVSVIIVVLAYPVAYFISFHGGDRKGFWLFVITLPMMAPAILSSLLVSFTISLDEFILAFFLSGTESTLPVYIWGQLRFAGKLPNVLALGTIMLVASVVLLGTAEVFRRRAARRINSMGAGLA